jgi:hypothetical protein
MTKIVTLRIIWRDCLAGILPDQAKNSGACQHAACSATDASDPSDIRF